MISVIVPIYNSERTLVQCINSILSQTFTDFELLLIDDGSTDNSGTICDNFSLKDTRIQVFHKDNGGVSSARNLGIKHASKKWITFCDSDDYVSPDWLAIFIKNANECDLVAQGLVFGNSQNVNGVDFSGNAKEGFKHLARLHILGYVYTKLFRIDIIRNHKIQFNEEFVFREDEDFVLRYLNVINKVICTKEFAYNYNIPNWDKKYANIDNFYCYCSIYSSVKQLLHNRYEKLLAAYLEEISNALCYSYDSKKADRIQRLKLYKKLVGKHIMHSKLNILLKSIIFFIPIPQIASCLLDLRIKLKNN